VPVIVAAVAAETGTVFTVKVALFAPAATVTVAGTVALETLEVNVTAAPPVEAGPVRVTVPVDGVPPATDVGDKVSDASPAAVMLRVAFADEVPRVAVRVAVVAVATAEVVTVKVALVAPAATLTVAGTVALVVLDESATAMPPVGAALPRVTVPVADVPPKTVVGATVKVLTTGGVMLKVAVTVTVSNLAVIVAVVVAATEVVVTVKVALVAPATTVTLAGTVALVALEVRVTTEPPVGAGPLRVTVPVDDVPPTTDVGETETAERLDAVIVRVPFAEVVW
jgi:hypothetical protein